MTDSAVEQRVDDDVSGSAYDLLRRRASGQADALRAEAQQIDEIRTEEFGAIPVALLAADRLVTELACRPRDMVQIGDLVLLGFNTEVELAAPEPEHTFALYRIDKTGGPLTPLTVDDPANFLRDPHFRDEYAKLLRFYAKATFTDLRFSGTSLLAAFTISDDGSDLRVLRWTVTPDDTVSFVDGRGERDYVWPDAHEVEWKRCTREDQRAGAHPTVSVLDEVFVGFRSGRLQLRAEAGGGTARSIVDEPVANPAQSLTDVLVSYATTGDLLLVTVELYSEPSRTYLFSRRSRTGTRVDSAGIATRLLPGGEGVVFPGGVFLSSTGLRTFQVDTSEMLFEETIVSGNGEDVMYVFHRRRGGGYLLMPYNRVRREVSQVIGCRGFVIARDGGMLLFREDIADADLSTLHAVQWWTTPFADALVVAARHDNDSWSSRVGNAPLVAGLGDIYDVVKLVGDASPNARTWTDVAAAARRTVDAHPWLHDEAARGVRSLLDEIASTAGQLVDEFAVTERRRQDAARQLADTETRVRSAVNQVASAATPQAVVSGLGELRRVRAEVAALGDVEYVDRSRATALGDEINAGADVLSKLAVEVLSSPVAFADFTTALAAIETEVPVVETSAALDGLAERVNRLVSDLDAVVDTVGSLDASDATVRTGIVRQVAEVSAQANRVRALVEGRRNSLVVVESDASFQAEYGLVTQTVAGAVSQCSTPDECDVTLSRLLVNVERLEARYGSDPTRLADIESMRELVHTQVMGRRQVLVDERNRRVSRVAEAGKRLIDTVAKRAAELTTDADVEAFFDADQLPSRIRDLVQELDDLGDQSQARELAEALRDAAELARRQLRDTAKLVDEDGAVRLGDFRLIHNNQPFELVTARLSASAVGVHVTGTDFTFDVSESLREFDDLLDRTFPSETSTVSRAEYLAWTILAEAVDASQLDQLSASAADGSLRERAARTAELRHADGYERGVHDHDAALIVTAVLPQLSSAPLARFTSASRALARLWSSGLSADDRSTWVARSAAAMAAVNRLGTAQPRQRLAAELSVMLAAIAEDCDFDEVTVASTADMVVESFADGGALIEMSSASRLVDNLRGHLGTDGSDALRSSVALDADIVRRYRTAADWLHGYLSLEAATANELAFDLTEAASIIAAPDVATVPISSSSSLAVTGLVSVHPNIDNGVLHTRLDLLAAGAGRLVADMTSRWPAYTAARQHTVIDAAQRLGLDEFRPRPMAGFVRNALIDEALLPMLGSNLARQFGTVDATDVARQGLLVVVSPPGYGKTTLMEWLADRLGVLIVKVNGPALGTDTTSLDPADAPNATARAEVDKINMAFRLGRNVLLYLDDIQHTSPVLLSRFIPLADATRRIEGVVDDVPTTFDLRGKRFAIVMAGNPYTTGGGRFEMPDMLVNRSDVFNLGDVTGTHADAFARSYVENSITSCPALAPHAAKLLDDLDGVFDMVAGRAPVQSAGLTHVWDQSDLATAVRSVALLSRVRDVLLKVNARYIASAATADADRDAPPFLLQGSYRNMSRIASRVVAQMTDAELDQLVDDHYVAESQTLTDRAEQNLLAYKTLIGRATDEEQQRWAGVCERFVEAAGNDQIGRVVNAMDRLTDAVVAADDQSPLAPPPPRRTR
jgi:hypothetical protein